MDLESLSSYVFKGNPRRVLNLICTIELLYFRHVWAPYGLPHAQNKVLRGDPF
jgi:hypothetical protein